MKRSSWPYLWLCILIATVGIAQDVWRSVPTVPRGPRDSDSVGATVDAVAIRGGKQSKARVVIYGARKSGILIIGIWIHGLSELIPEKELWPYTGPDLGHEARNPRMMQITLVSPTGAVKFDSRMGVVTDLSLPRGVDEDGSDMFAAEIKNDDHSKALLHKMNEGFDEGLVWIGRGVFSPPIEVKFGGEGIQSHLKTVLDFVELSKATGNTPTD